MIFAFCRKSLRLYAFFCTFFDWKSVNPTLIIDDNDTCISLEIKLTDLSIKNNICCLTILRLVEFDKSKWQSDDETTRLIYLSRHLVLLCESLA